MTTRSARIELDTVANAAYVALSDNEIVMTRQVTDLVLVDLDAMNVVVGIEVLSLTAELPFQRLADEFHVHSDVIETLRRIRPSVGAFVAMTSTGVAGASAQTAPQALLHTNC